MRAETSNPTLEDLIVVSLFYVQHLKFIHIIIRSGWSSVYPRNKKGHGNLIKKGTSSARCMIKKGTLCAR